MAFSAFEIPERLTLLHFLAIGARLQLASRVFVMPAGAETMNVVGLEPKPEPLCRAFAEGFGGDHGATAFVVNDSIQRSHSLRATRINRELGRTTESSTSSMRFSIKRRVQPNSAAASSSEIN